MLYLMIQIEYLYIFIFTFLSHHGRFEGVSHVALCALKQTDVAISDNTT